MTEANNGQDSQELANERTQWAEDRTLLANERTFAAWMRTGMACVGIALGLKAVFRATDYPIVAKSVAELFILCAILIFWAAVKRCYTTRSRISANDTATQSFRNMTLTATIMTLGASATGFILWYL